MLSTLTERISAQSSMASVSCLPHSLANFRRASFPPPHCSIRNSPLRQNVPVKCLLLPINLLELSLIRRSSGGRRPARQSLLLLQVDMYSYLYFFCTVFDEVFCSRFKRSLRFEEYYPESRNLILGLDRPTTNWGQLYFEFPR